ncbi:hypothetical protein [Prevotella jejuni]|uniref:hypothetical protein n=1 Tax=Prevotella jejuni TaxID=1177574 RepID=UPI0028EB9197|nr:hypothetical protein [Prevotella jejuni]
MKVWTRFDASIAIHQHPSLITHHPTPVTHHPTPVYGYSSTPNTHHPTPIYEAEKILTKTNRI